MRKFAKYVYDTRKNKVTALLMTGAASVPTFIDNDATALVFVLFLAVPIFFTKKQVVF